MKVKSSDRKYGTSFALVYEGEGRGKLGSALGKGGGHENRAWDHKEACSDEVYSLYLCSLHTHLLMPARTHTLASTLTHILPPPHHCHVIFTL